MQHSLFVLLLTLAMLLSGSLVQAQNVLLFTVDSCRADRFGVYGYSKSATPNIDRWAATGTVFEQAYSTSAWTAPGLVSILTGLYPPAHGVNNRDRTGSADLPTLLKSFQQKNFQVPNLNFFTFAPYYTNLGLPDIDRTFFGSEEEDALLNWFGQREVGEEPFFVWFHTTTVHQPYNPGQEDLLDGYSSPGIKAVLTGAIVPTGSTRFSQEDRVYLNQLYDAEISRMDRFFGRVLALLEKQDELEDTLVILTADHGEELLDHGFVGHASTSLQAKLYEELIRIPLIVSWPGRLPQGETVREPVSQIDIFPTVARLFQLEIPSFIQGRDLFSKSRTRTLFFESVAAGNQTPREREDEWLRAVRKGRFKYISSGELYDLERDPGEKINLAGKQPELVAQFSQELDDWLLENRSLYREIFNHDPKVHSTADPGSCPKIHTPQNGSTLDYDIHTGAVLFDWSGDMQTAYQIEYDIGTGDHHVEGEYKVEGNHQLLGPFPPELWKSLKAWNPFKFRVSPAESDPCWSKWVEFNF